MTTSDDVGRGGVNSIRAGLGAKNLPKSPEHFAHKKDHNRAEAALLAVYVFAHSNSSWSIVASDSIQQAKEKALSECRSKGGQSCHIVATVCADGAERYVYDKE